jgi:hypothetical protein
MLVYSLIPGARDTMRDGLMHHVNRAPAQRGIHMKLSGQTPRIMVAAAALAAFACTDSPTPSEPSARGLATSLERSSVAQDRLAALFPDVSRDVMSLPGTVFADNDEVRGKLVFGVENAHAVAGVQRSLAARGLSADDYVVEVTAPIQRMSALTDRIRATQGGTQIHFGNYLCTLGFNVDHSGERSFITNSHCTTNQGGVDGTTYAQPTRTIDPTVIATEVQDPFFVSGGNCSAGKVCRSSDASRAAYSAGTESARGVIAKTTGVNTGSLTIAGTFSVTAQDDANTSFSGTVNKVGRTTGWTQGNITNTCATVNVSQSNVQLFCQTLVSKNGTALVGAGDSGSPVFRITSGDDVTLIGILWGGSGSSTFVFSPLASIEAELGAVSATADGSGGGGGGTEPPPTCIPKGKGKNCH